MVNLGFARGTARAGNNKGAIEKLKVVVLTTPKSRQEIRSVHNVSHLGSEILAECRTRPQYVLRSNCDTGRSRLPGKEDVMSTSTRRAKP
jgi:hypothetical protein